MIEKYKIYTCLLSAFLWLSLCWGFVQDEIAPGLEHVRSFVFLFADFVFLVLGLYALRCRRDVYVVVSFMLILLFSAVLNRQGIITIFNGSRDFIGLLLAAPVIRMLLLSKYSERFEQSFDRQLLVFLSLQTVCVTWQFFKYGPGDYVGGSMGEGASGTISVLIYFISFYLMIKRWDGELSYFMNIRKNFLLIFLLYPTFLNETKISLVLFVFYFILLVKIDRDIVLKAIKMFPIIIVLSIASVTVYSYVVDTDAGDVFTEDNMYNYFIGEDIDYLIDVAMKVQDQEIETDNVWAVDIPRISKLVLAPVILDDTGGKIWLGAGVGQFKGASVIGQTSFARKNNWFLQGSRPLLFFIIVQLGVIGLVWLLINLITIIQTGDRFTFAWNIRLYLYLLIAMSMLYNDSFRLYPYCFILFYIAMTGLAYREGRTEEMRNLCGQ